MSEHPFIINEVNAREVLGSTEFGRAVLSYAKARRKWRDESEEQMMEIYRTAFDEMASYASDRPEPESTK